MISQFILAAAAFSDLDHYLIILTVLLLVFLIIFGFWGRYGGRP